MDVWGGIRQWTRQRKREHSEGDGEAVIGVAMGWRRKAVTNYCRLRGGKGIGRWWNERIGRTEDAECPRCGEKEKTPDHIVFRCRNIKRVKDKKGRREWAREVVVRWDNWDALASKNWIRMEDTGRVDDEGKAVWI